MKLLYFLLTVFVMQQTVTNSAYGQCDTNRYKTPIFNAVFKHADILYGEGQVWNIPYNNTDLKMDIYEPIGDTLLQRPLMLWVHPGGFLLGDKGVDDMVALCDSFAKRGYVTASIGYRLGFNPASAESAERAVYRGTQDIRAAIRYFKEYASIYRIDTNTIFLGGSSAGGFAALHVAYLDQNEAPSSITGGLLSPDLGCLDCSGNNFNHSVELAGLVNLWGALGDSSFVDADETVPALLVHGTADGVVPFGVGQPFGVFTTPFVNGSRTISNQLNSLGIPHSTLFFAGQDHEPHGTSNGTFDTPPTPYWDTIFDAIENHYWKILKPTQQSISGTFDVCLNAVQTYTLETSENARTCWNVAGGTILAQYPDSIRIRWDQPGNHVINYITYSSLDAASNESTYDVVVRELPSAEFTIDQEFATCTFEAVSSDLTYDWTFAGIGNATGQTANFSFPLNGTFAVELSVVDEFGCTNQQVQYVTVQGLSVDEQVSTPIAVFPNPFENSLQVSGITHPTEIKLVDLSGKILFSERTDASGIVEINQSIASGLYWIEVKTETQVIRKLIQHL